MSNKEIEKQAESLIDQLLPITRARMGEDREVVRLRAIKAAIVSCEFFLQRIGPNLADFSYNQGLPITPSVHTEVTQIKAYLEGLL